MDLGSTGVPPVVFGVSPKTVSRGASGQKVGDGVSSFLWLRDDGSGETPKPTGGTPVLPETRGFVPRGIRSSCRLRILQTLL